MSFLCRYAHSAFTRYRPSFPRLAHSDSARSWNSCCETPFVSKRSRVVGRESRKTIRSHDISPTRCLCDARRGGVVSGSGLERTDTESLQLADVLQKLRTSLLPTASALTHTVTTLSTDNAVPSRLWVQCTVLEGVGRHLGLDIAWSLTLGPNGAFVEQFKGDAFSCAWGATGTPSCTAWETDYSGVTRVIDLDDLEACLLTTWLRSGQWLMPSVLEELHVELVETPTTKSAAADEAVMSSWTDGAPDTSLCRDTTSGETPVSTSLSTEPVSTVDLTIRLKTGKVKITVRVDRASWRPIEISQELFGDKETWSLHNWQNWGQTRVLFPEEIVHTATSGGRHQYTTQSGRHAFSEPSVDLGPTFQPPLISLSPPNCEFDHTISSTIPAWKTPSCHVLVKPRVNGKDIGYMILDTGASGLVMEKVAADALGLEGFGELFVSGVSGKVPAHFRRAESLILGPLIIKQPQFMEMPVPGLVAGHCHPVVGIIGYDVFRRAVVEMKPMDDSDGASVGDPNFVVHLHAVEQPSELPPSIDWCHLHMITNLPHIKARFSTNGTAVYEGLFMIDTGAGGAFVMFMSRAVDEYGLQNDLQSNVKTFVKGVGGSQTERLPVQNGALSWFELGGKKLNNISCLFFNGSKMDISVYACGILCMNMLQDSRLIIDYARQRMAVIPSDVTDNGRQEASEKLESVES